MKTNNPNAGFTLVEAVLSIAILAIISLPLLSYFTDSMRYSSMMAKQQQATFLAQEITEGLLAENRLVVKVADEDGLEDEDGNTISGYIVPYLENEKGYSYDETAADASKFRSSGEGTAVFTSTVNTDGTGSYDVKVTITSENGPLEDVQDFEDYVIDPFTDIVYMDTTENNQAVFELMGAHYTYYTNHPEEPLVEVEEDTVMKEMSRDIYVHLTNELDGYRVRIWYEYKCDEVHGANSTATPGIWNWGWNKSKDDDNAVLLDQKVKDLQNIYLIYQWCDGGDTVYISSDNSFDIDIELYIIYQPRNDDDQGPEIYDTLKLKFNDYYGSGKITGYTNAEGGRVIRNRGFAAPGTIVSEDAKVSLMYEINTKVYPTRGMDPEDPLADITARKGE